MKRWVVRLPTLADGTPLPDIIVQAETMGVEEGVLIFDTDTKIVRAFGVGMWHDVEPLAEVPEENPNAVGTIYHPNAASHLARDAGECSLCNGGSPEGAAVG